MLEELTGYTYAHDPVIIKDDAAERGGLYYRLNTGPGVPISVSRDLHHWQLAGKAMREAGKWIDEVVPARKHGSIDFWAPDVVQRSRPKAVAQDGSATDCEWRMYYSVSTFGSNVSAIALAVCPSMDEAVRNGFTDKGCVIASNESSPYNCIDPQVLTDEDGRDLLLFGSFWLGLFAVRLDAAGRVAEGATPVNIARRWSAREADEDSMKSGRIPNPIEGGYIYCHDGSYYLFASHDYCCRGTSSSYHIVVGRSDTGALGPYYDKAGAAMLDGGGSTLRDGASCKRWAGPGHCSVLRDGEVDYLVYHAYDRQCEGRQTLQIERITWRAGWPELD